MPTSTSGAWAAASFGTWITWFLVGGDFYTAYTVIAVPALVYAVGAYGFFALPYTIVVYPLRLHAVMPHPVEGARGSRGYVTAGDVVRGTIRLARLELAVAVHRRDRDRCPISRSQLVGMDGGAQGAGACTANCRSALAFLVLALYTYSVRPAGPRR